MGDSLKSVNLKLARANEHLELVRDEVDTFLEPADAEKPYGSILQKDDEAGKRLLCASVIRGPGSRLSVLIGDVLHNARSALDHLAWKLGGDPPPNESASEFPIFLHRDRFRRGNGRSGYEKIGGVEDRAQAVIEDMQPFNSRDKPELHPLWLLHQLSREDKHRLLLVTGLAVQGGAEAYLHRSCEGDRLSLGLTDFGGILNLGAFKVGDPIAEWTAGELSREPKSHEDLNIVFGVAFSPEGPGRGLEVTDALADCLYYIERVVISRLAPFL